MSGLRLLSPARPRPRTTSYQVSGGSGDWTAHAMGKENSPSGNQKLRLQLQSPRISGAPLQHLKRPPQVRQFDLAVQLCQGDYRYVVVDLNSFVSKRPFFANKKVTFANLSRIHRRALFISRVGESQLLSASVVSEMTISQLQL